MLAHVGLTPAAAFAALAIWLCSATAGVSANAVQEIARPSTARASQPVKANKTAEEEEDEEDESFFSGGLSGGAKRTVATAAPAMTTASVSPSVDVASTCRAVLADNLNYYNWNFIEGCKRAIGRR